MLSRHNIRIKVLQTLYAYLQSEHTNTAIAEKDYLKAVQESYRLYLLNMLYLIRVANYSKKDFDIKSKKFVPTEEDKKASLRLYENPVLEALRENEDFHARIRKEKLSNIIDDDLVRKLYQNFAKSEYYNSYLEMSPMPAREHQYCLVNLYKSMLENEHFLEHLEDISPTSEDDQSLIFGAIKRSVRSLPEEDEFYIAQLPNEEFVHDFGKELLYKAIRHNDELHDLVVDKLKNWNEDRVAVLDMLLLKLGICEFLYFPSIPTKVTINEYVSLAKDYSTDKSKRFINGILDRLMKDLMEKGLISKEGRGLKEN
ncbi:MULTISPECIES: transcription antitermination factor NusB [unclassified Aureispira]|uniref:transcription antitermination factor NusB n=1 Tax=unclassified Aureispira TaxID=2649989 RepID=UPI000696D0CE|nr:MULTISPECIES: transcription antitermination factor NusB [unclassified Aureispira]WMX12075.1 transcription antitermination factor NusB [Aureispira sp. CCB-E]